MPWHNKVLWGSSVLGLPPSLIWVRYDNNLLTLVNDTLRRLNEVELTATDFPNATGFRAQVKDAINSSIQEISQREFEFPFNFTAGSLTLVIGTQEYALESDFKIADWDSFRINYDADNNHSARNLKLIST